MSETKEAAIFDPNAHIEAVAIRFDTGSETWQLQSVGTLEECRQSCLRARSKGCEQQMRVYRVNVFRDRSNYANHGTVENADAVDAERYRWLREQKTQSEWVAPMPQPDFYQDGAGVFRNEP